MREHGLRGVVRGRAKRTTISGEEAHRAGDLVNWAFSATAPNQPWVADFTYLRTWAGSATSPSSSTSTPAVSWAGSCRSRCAPTSCWTPLEMGLWTRRREGHDVTGLTHHGDVATGSGFRRRRQTAGLTVSCPADGQIVQVW